MVSDEGQSLIRDKLIMQSMDGKKLKVKKINNKHFQTKFLYKGKLVEEIEPDFFIVNVAHGQSKHDRFKILNNNYFPPANRKNPQKPKDVQEYLRKYKGQHSYEKYANFHLLLYLSKMIDIYTVITICDCVREKREVP